MDYSVDLELDLATVVPSVAGPKRPQDRIELPNLKTEFLSALKRPITESGFGKQEADLAAQCPRSEQWPSARGSESILRRPPRADFQRIGNARSTSDAGSAAGNSGLGIPQF